MMSSRKKALATPVIPATMCAVKKINNPMGAAMKAFLICWFLAVVMTLVACGGGKDETLKDIEVVGDADTVTIDEEPVGDSDIPVADADTALPESPVTGEQAWFGALPTGQTKCYDNEKEISCPAAGSSFFGQDPQFNQWKARLFVPQADGTVKDDVTGLRWQLDAMSDLTWDGASIYCRELVIGAYTRWRLPTPHELKSLIDYGLILDGKPAHPATTFPCNLSGGVLVPAGCKPIDHTPNDWFWATARSQDPLMAWVVYFYDGFLEYTERDNLYSVRCVTTE